MAIGTEVFYHTDAKVVLHDAGAATPQGTLVKLTGNDRFGVTLTDTIGVATSDIEIGPYTINMGEQPGVGNELATTIDVDGFAAPIATDGTWEFTGAASAADGTGTSSISVAQGAAVYFHAGTGKVTTASIANNLVGYVNYPATATRVAGTIPVKIGA